MATDNFFTITFTRRQACVMAIGYTLQNDRQSGASKIHHFYLCILRCHHAIDCDFSRSNKFQQNEF
jgi:hypothetical protein